MKYLRNDSTDPHWNMAFDEFCLEQLPLEEPVFYLWQNRPSVIIGLNQNAYGEVNLQYLRDHGITLARRVTGGGAVYHDLQNLNYTIMGRSADMDSDYPQYTGIMASALRSLGVDAELSGRNDIMVGGRKVSGYAKRVWKDRLMIHGTLMWNVDIDELTRALDVPGSKLSSTGIASVHSRVANLRDCLPHLGSVKELKAVLERMLSRNYEDPEIILTEAQKAEIQTLRDSKFSTWEWNLGRSLGISFSRREKFACGTIEASLSVEHGIIKDISFSGDFLGNLPVSGLEDALRAVRYERAAVLDAIKQQPVEEYFDRLSPDDLLRILF